MLREKKKLAQIGFMAMNVVTPPKGAFWGRFNDRKLREGWVDELEQGFEKSLENCTDETAIDVAIKKQWLKNAGLIVSSVEGKSIMSIPVMEFTPEGEEEIGHDNLWVLGGNHRREALGRYVIKKKKQLDENKTRIDSLENGKADSDTGQRGAEEDEHQDLDTLKRLSKRLEEQVEGSCFWAVRLYDRGA